MKTLIQNDGFGASIEETVDVINAAAQCRCGGNSGVSIPLTPDIIAKGIRITSGTHVYSLLPPDEHGKQILSIACPECYCSYTYLLRRELCDTDNEETVSQQSLEMLMQMFHVHGNY